MARRRSSCPPARGLCVPLHALLLFQVHDAAAASAAPRGAYGTVACQASDAVIAPSSTQQLAEGIRAHAAAAAKAGQALKIRATHSIFHSTTTLPCAGGRSGSGSGSGRGGGPGTVWRVAVVTDRFNRVTGADDKTRRLRAQAGATVSDVLRAAQARGWSPDRGAPTTYSLLTLGGVLATSAHGSGFNVSSTLAHLVTELTWVDAAGAVHVSARGSDEAKALLGGIGVVGIIAEAELQFGPATRTRAVSVTEKGDGDLLADIEAMRKDTPTFAVAWAPDLGKYAAHLLRPTDAPSGGAVMGFLPSYSPPLAATIKLALDTWDGDAQLSLGPVTQAGGAVGCLGFGLDSVASRFAKAPLGPPALGADLPLDDGVGETGEVVSGPCGAWGCPWDGADPWATSETKELVVEYSDLPAWVADARRVFAMDLEGGPGPASQRCLGGYIYFQFGKASDAFTATTAGMRQPVHVIMTIAHSTLVAPRAPPRYAFVHDVLEQLTLCKYRGRPHWGKNWERTFTHPSCPVAARYPRFPKLLEAQARYDPGLVFEPDVFARIKAGAPYKLSPQCDFKKTCYCAADAHCAAGFKCAASAAFPEYRVCKPAVMAGGS